MVLCIELEHGGVGKKMLKGECGSGGGEKFKVLLRPGGGHSGQGAVCQVVCKEISLSRSSHLSYTRTLWRHPTSQMRRLGSKEQNEH